MQNTTAILTSQARNLVNVNRSEVVPELGSSLRQVPLSFLQMVECVQKLSLQEREPNATKNIEPHQTRKIRLCSKYFDSPAFLFLSNYTRYISCMKQTVAFTSLYREKLFRRRCLFRLPGTGGPFRGVTLIQLPLCKAAKPVQFLLITI